MGVWMGDVFHFTLDAVDFEEQLPDCSWRYHTSSDVLTLSFSYPEGRDAYNGSVVPAREVEQLYGPEEGKALLMCLLDWDARYNNSETLEKFKKERLKLETR